MPKRGRHLGSGVPRHRGHAGSQSEAGRLLGGSSKAHEAFGRQILGIEEEQAIEPPFLVAAGERERAVDCFGRQLPVVRGTCEPEFYVYHGLPLVGWPLGLRACAADDTIDFGCDALTGWRSGS